MDHNLLSSSLSSQQQQQSGGLIGSISQKIRDNKNILPQLAERTGKELTKRWEQAHTTSRYNSNQKHNHKHNPPSNTDIVYLTDRFLVSSKPAIAVGGGDGFASPTFLDIGRDVVVTKQSTSAKQQQQQQRGRGKPPRPRPASKLDDYDRNDNDNGDGNDDGGSNNKQFQKEISTSSILNRSLSTNSIPESSEKVEKEKIINENPQDGCSAVVVDDGDDAGHDNAAATFLDTSNSTNNNNNDVLNNDVLNENANKKIASSNDDDENKNNDDDDPSSQIIVSSNNNNDDEEEKAEDCNSPNNSTESVAVAAVLSEIVEKIIIKDGTDNTESESESVTFAVSAVVTEIVEEIIIRDGGGNKNNTDDAVSAAVAEIVEEIIIRDGGGNKNNTDDAVSAAVAEIVEEIIIRDGGGNKIDNDDDDMRTSPSSDSTEVMSKHNKVNYPHHQQQQQQQQSTPQTKNLTRAMVMVGNNMTVGNPSLLMPSQPVDVSPPSPENNNDSSSSVVISVDDDENDDVNNNNIEQQQQQQQSPSKESSNANANGTIHPLVASSSTRTTIMKNSPGNMVTYLDKAHGRDRYLALSLAKEGPDDRTLLLFRRQIVNMGGKKWSPCCVERSETPSITHILKICYAIHAYLQLDPNNVVLTYCDNGKTRTAIVAACYLKFTNMVARTEDGFRYFLSQLRKHRQLLLEREREQRKNMGPVLSAAFDAVLDEYEFEKNDEETSNTFVANIINQIPPSLRLFFRQFDKVLQLGGFLNHRPLLLRAITLQGVPVEDQPCLDIWDSSQRHVYSSHPTTALSSTTLTTGNNNKDDDDDDNDRPVSQWVDEEGFYRINVVLDGEFLLLCRFGGPSSTTESSRIIHDPSKILFRYTNTTGFLSGGCAYELPPKKVDLMRRYSDHLDDEDFMLTLLFEADWEQMDNDDDNAANNNSINHRVIPAAMKERLKTTSESCGKRVWRCHEEEARDEGWKVIFDCHSARPAIADIESFRRFYGNQEIPDINHCPDHLIALSLQLTNYDFQRTTVLVIDSPVFSWWRKGEPSNFVEATSDVDNKESCDEKKDEKIHFSPHEINVNDKKTFREIEDEATKNIFNILDQIDVTTNLDPPDIRYLQELNEVQSKVNSSIQDSSQGVREQRKESPPTQEGMRQESLSGLCLKETGYRVPSMMYPRRGDIVRSFNLHGECVPTERRTEEDPAFKVSISKPRLPYFPHNKPKLLPSPSPRLQNKNDFDKIEVRRVPIYDSKLEAAKEIHRQLRHTGVTLKDLIELEEASKHWTGVRDDSTENTDMSSESNNPISTTDEAITETKLPEPIDLSMNREEKEKKEKKWKEVQLAEAEEKRKELQEKRHSREKTKTGEQETDTVKLVDVPLKDDPEYAKYFKMIKMGLAREQVSHSMKRDEKDPKILDLDPNKSLNSQELPVVEATGDDGPPLKDDPEYSKYFKMKKMGMQKEQILHAMKRDEKDPKIFDLDPNKSLKSQQLESAGDDGPPLKDDPEYSKYFKMTKMGMQKEQVMHAMKRDEKDPGILDLDPNKSLKSQQLQPAGDDGPPLKDDPEYAKYFKMEKMGLPKGAVKNALVRDGKDPGILDLDPNKSVKSQIGGGAAVEEKDTGILLKDDPEFTKYFKMEKMGLPRDAVKNALVRDGKDPSIIDLDPNKSVAFQMKKKSNPSAEKVVIKKKKKKVRRKKIYWNPIDPNKLQKDSLWNIVRDHVAMKNLSYDQKEFEELFTESAESSALKKKKAPQKEAKKLVQAIDPKRSMNGGIVLSRLKTDRKKVAEYVDKMEYMKFDATQLKNLKEYLANADERRSLIAYMSKGENSEEKKNELYNDLSETEKYMVTLMDVADADAKLHTMGFRKEFKNRFADITSGVKTLNDACDELRSSGKLRKLMAMILTVVNQINTGGEGNLATGFTLDALLKLNEAKAFDKKTSVLHYVVKLVKKNDETLLAFESDISNVIPAESVLLDTVVSDVKVIQEELEDVIKIVSSEAERLEKDGKLPKPTLADLLEQKSMVQHVGCVPQFNKIAHLTGRTSMERFSMNAKVACEQTVESIEKVKTKYALVLSYFGEDENMSTGDFFGILRKFMSEWKTAIKQVEKIERAHAKERKREERRAAKEKSKGSKADSGKTNDIGRGGSGGIFSLAAGAPKNKKKLTKGDIGALAAQAALKRNSAKQSKVEAPKKVTMGGIGALAAQAALKRSERNDEEARKLIIENSTDEKKSEARSQKSAFAHTTSSLPTSVENNMVSKINKPSAIEVKVENSTPPTSLGSFLERHQPSSDHELRNEILRQNYDDSSVAIMAAETLEKSDDSGNNNNNDNTAWNSTELNGISDYLGWANQAIKASDTESVRGFEASRNIIDNYDHDDESTIATNFDDDASIATAMTSPRDYNYDENEPSSYNNHHDNNDYPDDIYNNQHHDSYGGNDHDDAVINMPVTFNTVGGLGGGLSFGDGDGDGGFDDNTGMYDDGAAGSNDLFGVDDGLDSGLGGFGSPMGMLSPTNGHQKDHTNSNPMMPMSLSMSPPTTTTTTNSDNLNRPWGATIDIGDNTDLNRPWGASATSEGDNNNNNKTDQQQPKKWFSAWGGGA